MDVRWHGDGYFPVGGATCAATDAIADSAVGREFRPTLDGGNHRAVPAGRGRRRIAVWVDRRSFWTHPRHDVEHSVLLDFHRFVLFRPRTVAVGSFSFRGRAGHGRGMGTRRGVGHGDLAREKTYLNGGSDRRG